MAHKLDDEDREKAAKARKAKGPRPYDQQVLEVTFEEPPAPETWLQYDNSLVTPVYAQMIIEYDEDPSLPGKKGKELADGWAFSTFDAFAPTLAVLLSQWGSAVLHHHLRDRKNRELSQ